MTRRVGGGLAALALTVVGLFLLALCVGDVLVPLPEVLASLTGASEPSFVVQELRLPRALGAVVAGLGLGASGAITQSLLRNPLASPDIIGVTSGAGAAAVAVLAGGAGAAVSLTLWSLPAAAALGGLVAGALVALLSWRSGLQVRRVILVGLGVNAGLGAVTSWMLLRADLPGLNAAMLWLAGTLNQVSMDELLLVGPVVGVLLLVAALLSRPLAVLRFDDLTAQSLGLRLGLSRVLLFAVAVVLASVVTALVGTVGFVAFIAPQVAAALLRTEGPPPVGAALTGAVIMLAADLVAAHVFWVDLPVGIVTSVVGAPFLLWVLLRRRGR